MSWTLYRNWSGGVNGARIRVPASVTIGVTCYGVSQNPMLLRKGAVGTIRDVCTSAGAPPDVQFKGRVNFMHAIRVEIERSHNADVVWQDLYTGKTGGDLMTVYITRSIADGLEIEFDGG